MANTVSLATDYLIIGAGALGMGFLDELINNSSDLRAVIVDKRDKPGGHWNDAYSFVRLHQPAVTYGLNSRTLGVGGADLASKSQILSHFELGLADLLATGRVTFLSQCQYIGDGRVKSLLDEDLQYEVKYSKKIVDATHCETHVPATSKPNFTVEEDVKFVPINGLSSVREKYDQYLIVGGGKTGIDATLYLLDHGVDPDKIAWIVPNDAWFFNRDKFAYDDDVIAFFQEFFDGLSDDRDKTWQDVYLRLEKVGTLMRLDTNITPTRNRLATVSPAELVKLHKIKKIIRKGRLRSIARTRLEFLTGEEMELIDNTLVVDCAVNSIKFKPKTKVFSGDKIILQYIMFPPFGQSISAITAMELKYPEDEEKKNSICIPFDIPQTTTDYFIAGDSQNKVEEAVNKEFGLFWMRSRRCYNQHHLSVSQMMSFYWMLFRKGDVVNKKYEMCVKQIQNTEIDTQG